MPIYEYEHLAAGDVDPGTRSCGARFEHIEDHGARPLETCPVCGQPVRRVPSGFSWARDVLATSNIKEKGFTRLRRKDKGVYSAD